MSEKEKVKVTIEAETLDKVMRRLFALKEMVEATMESLGDLMIQSRPNGSSPTEQKERPATFGSRTEPVETASEVPGWQQVAEPEIKG